MNDRDPENPVLHAAQCGSRLMTETLIVMLFALLTWGFLLAAAFFDLLRPRGWSEGSGSALIQIGLSLGVCLGGIMIFVWLVQVIRFCQALLLRDAPDSTPQGRAYFWLMFIPGFFLFLFPVAALPSAWKKGRLYGKILALLCVTMYSVSAFWLFRLCSMVVRLASSPSNEFGLFSLMIDFLGGDASSGGTTVLVCLFSDICWTVLSLIAASGLLYFMVKNLGEVPRLRGRSILLACTLGLYLLAPVAAHGCFVLLNRELEHEKAIMNRLGVTPGRAYLKNLYYQGREPNAEWTTFLREISEAREHAISYSDDGEGPAQVRRLILETESPGKKNDVWFCLLLSCVGHYSPMQRLEFSEDDFDAIGQLLAENRAYLDRIDRTFPPGGDPVRVARDYDTPKLLLAMMFSDLIPMRNLTSVYCARMAISARAGDRTAVMNHFLRLQTFIRSRFYGAMFLELLMGVRDFQLQMWLPQVFAERVLNDEDLVEIEAWLLAQESVLISSTRIAEAGETSFLADFETISRTLGDYEHPERYPASPARKTILSPFYCVLEQELIAIFRRYRETLETLASPDWRPSVHSQKFLSRQNERAKSAEDRRMYLALFSPNLSVCEEALNIGFSSLRLLRIACRVERFRLREGRLPATLDELGDLGRDLPPDPFSGKPFRYRVGAIRFSSVYEHSEHRNSEKTGRGYLLYGVGKDLSDDGGRFLPDGKTKDDILMVLDPGSVRDAEPSP